MTDYMTMVSSEMVYNAALTCQRVSSAVYVAVDAEGNRLRLTGLEASVLAAVQGFKSVTDHARAIWATGQLAEPSDVVAAIERLACIGLLRVLQTGDHSAWHTRRRALAVVIVTADRPRSLERCLQALVLQCTRFNRAPRLLVVDGSKNPAVRLENRRSVESLSRSPCGQLPARYVGRDEFAPIASSLATSPALASAVKAGLSIGDIGSNRNIGTLLVGESDILMLDDDILLRPWHTPDMPGAVEWVGHRECREWRFFESRHEALAGLGDDPIDLIGAHEAALGRPIADLAPGLPLRGHHACTDMVQQVAMGSGVIRFTLPGIAGDSARYCPQSLLHLDGPIREVLFRSEATFDIALASREVQRVAPSLAVSHDCSLATYCLGIDTSRPIPPFMPRGRNEDGIFGLMASSIEPASLLAHLPVGVIHDSDRAASTRPDQDLTATSVRYSDYVGAGVSWCSASCSSDDPNARLAALGRGLVVLGSASLETFRRRLVPILVASRAQSLSQLDMALRSDPTCPGYVLAEVARYRETFATACQMASWAVPAEERGRSIDAGIEHARSHVLEMGQLVEAWAELQASAKTHAEALWEPA